MVEDFDIMWADDIDPDDFPELDWEPDDCVDGLR